MQEEKLNWLCRWSPTLGELEGTAEDVWGTEKYKIGEEYLEQKCSQINEPCVFFGLYGLPDFYKLWRHRGRKCILWAGTDIIQFKNGYWLEEGGGIKISPKPLATWINKYCESYVENKVEQEALKEFGIESKIVPSFLGNVADFPLSYKPGIRIQLYTSVSGDNFKLYGWDKIYNLARENPKIEFHLYGNTKPFPIPDSPEFSNIIIHGRVPKDQMNTETKEMTGALRLTEFDGFSEIIAKSLLWGQWPVSSIHYPNTLSPTQLNVFNFKLEPNYAGREWLLSVVNQYPWNQK